MGIRFIFGRAGSGKSHYCLEQIKKKISNDKNNKLILLVPDQYTFQTEKKLLEAVGEKAQLRAEVLSFKRMATRVFDNCGGRATEVIKDSGKNMLIYKLLKDKGEELLYFSKISRQQGFVGIVAKSITEFKKYNMDIKKYMIDYRIIRHENKFYNYGPFNDDKRPNTNSEIKGLVLAGDYTRQKMYATMEGAVISGINAYKFIIDNYVKDIDI